MNYSCDRALPRSLKERKWCSPNRSFQSRSEGEYLNFLKISYIYGLSVWFNGTWNLTGYITLITKNRTYKSFILSGSEPLLKFQNLHFSITLTFWSALMSSLLVHSNSCLSRISHSSLQKLLSQLLMFLIFHVVYQSIPFLCHIHYYLELFWGKFVVYSHIL